MDNLETISNASDSLSSNLSSLSGLTGYEEELYDLKHLIGASRSPRSLKNSNGDPGNFAVFEERTWKLHNELQDALKLNEKYKNDIHRLERQTELAFHEKFEKIMKHNVQLETQLSIANNRIRALLDKQVVNDHQSRVELEGKAKQLEKQNFEVNTAVSLLQNEVAHWKSEVESGEVTNGRLKLELEEARIEVNTKSNSIAALKGKIVDLHVQMQNLIQANIKANNSLLIVSNELASYKKSELWYKEQLHQCRLQKSHASEDIAQLHSVLAVKENDLNVCNTDINRLKNRYEELQFISHQEKQNLLKTIDKLESRPCSIEAVQANIEDRSALETYESTIQSLTRELATIKDAVNDQQVSFEALNKQNSDLVTQSTTLQKILNQREISISNLEADKKDLDAKLGISAERLREQEKYLMNVGNEKSELEVALSRANFEKQEIEEAVDTIRENFSKFADKYRIVKEELCEKSRLILVLQNEQLVCNDNTKQLELSAKTLAEVEERNRQLHSQITNFKIKHEQTIEALERSGQNYEKLKSEVANLKQELEAHEETFLKERRKFESELWLSNQTRRELESEVRAHQQIASSLKEELDKVVRGKQLEVKQIKDQFSNKLSSCSQAKLVLESEVRAHQQIATSLKEELDKVVRGKQIELKQIEDQFSNKLSSCSQAKLVLESEVILQQQTITNLKEELHALKENMTALVGTLEAKEGQICQLNSNIGTLTSHVQKLELTEVDPLNQFLQRENCELKDQLAKFVANNFNGYSRMNKEKQTELELWFLCVLEWVSKSVLEIQAGSGAKQSLSGILSNCLNEEIRKTLVELDQLFLSVASAMCAQSKLLQKVSLSNKQLKGRITNKMLQVEERCDVLKDHNEVLQGLKARVTEKQRQISSKIIESVRNEEKLLEEIKNLKALCKAKELENKEKQKRYEVNNRTLLKKVKEHMRGRSSAEKRCNYLQQLYNDLFDELNSCKLHEASQDGEIQNLQSTCDNYKNIGAKMKDEVLRLEKQLATLEAECIEYDLLKKNVAILEAKLQASENQIQMDAQQLKEKEILISSFQVEVQGMLLNSTTLQKDNNNLLKRIKEFSDSLSNSKGQIQELQEALEKERIEVQDLHGKLQAQQKEHLVCVMQLESTQQAAQHIQEKNEMLDADVKALTGKLDQSSTKISSLQAEKNLLESSWHQEETRLLAFVVKLQSEVEVLQNDLSSVRSDKYFLQRMCSDLKLALQTCMNQSKVFKKHIQTLSAESRECTSLPDPVLNLPSPSKYDDAYINQLLKQSSAPPVGKPLGDLQNCLNSLKKEMICLKKQVTEKASYRA